METACRKIRRVRQDDRAGPGGGVRRHQVKSKGLQRTYQETPNEAYCRIHISSLLGSHHPFCRLG